MRAWGRGQREEGEQYPEEGREETAGENSNPSPKPLQLWVWYCTP